MNCSVLPGPYAVDRAPRAKRTTCNTPADTAALTSGPAQAHWASNGLRDVEKDVYSRQAAFPFFITDLATKFY